jgi:hypothetical protein
MPKTVTSRITTEVIDDYDGAQIDDGEAYFECRIVFNSADKDINAFFSCANNNLTNFIGAYGARDIEYIQVSRQQLTAVSE